MNKAKNQAAVELGRLGGKAARGEAKRRSPEHYAKMVAARAAQRKADAALTLNSQQDAR